MTTKMEPKLTMFQLLTQYLTNTRPLVLILHLFYIMSVCAILSFSYIFAFHWTSVVQIYTEAHDIKGFNTNLKNSVETDAKLNEILHEIRNKTRGMRSYIYRYHNGLAAISSVPFFFQTNTHETISPGAARLMPFEQRLPASFNVAINNQFVKNQCGIVSNADNDKDAHNYFYFQNRGAKAYVRCPIFLPNGDLFGFVGVDYATNPSNMKEVADIVQDASITIGNIFANTKK